MGKLTEILRQHGSLDAIESAWDRTPAAKENGLLPAGKYTADIIHGEPFTGRTNGTPGYKFTFNVVEGEHEGSRFWHDVWFTDDALSRTKRDLQKLGVTNLEQLEKPLPGVFRCKVRLVVRRDDEFETNVVRQFEVLSFHKPEPDEFAPPSVSRPVEVDLDDVVLPLAVVDETPEKPKRRRKVKRATTKPKGSSEQSA